MEHVEIKVKYHQGQFRIESKIPGVGIGYQYADAMDQAIPLMHETAEHYRAQGWDVYTCERLQ